jgi:hypothetical protein
MAELRKQEGIAARALEFTILTGARSGEARGIPGEGELLGPIQDLLDPAAHPARRLVLLAPQRASICITNPVSTSCTGSLPITG